MPITSPDALADLGWSAFFQSQLSLDDLQSFRSARIMAVHRGAFNVDDGNGPRRSELLPADEATVGDWLLVDPATERPVRVLERKSVFKRRAAGSEGRTQLIAANVDTLFVVTSCNRDFNIARLERYLALAAEAGVTPVVVLTKADTCDTPTTYRDRAAALVPGLMVETVDARDPAAVAPLALWCKRGQTVALVGSSGVGKSTLVNTLAGNDIATQPVREDDARGRHTTTGRAMHRLAAGGWLLDTPGMRELGLVDAASGIETVFDDVAELAVQCRFGDCRHENEPGCAVQAAVAAGTLAADRLERYRKLVAEERRNTATIAERRARDRAFGRMLNAVSRARRERRGS